MNYFSENEHKVGFYILVSLLPVFVIVFGIWGLVIFMFFILSELGWRLCFDADWKDYDGDMVNVIRPWMFSMGMQCLFLFLLAVLAKVFGLYK